MSDELKLNSLSRFRKSSQQLILEAYGHCEVPAGCGGAVLRWTNPAREIPLQIWIHANGTSKLFLDGAPLTGSLPMVPFGEHLLAIALDVKEPEAGLLMFAALYDEESQRVSRSASRQHQVRLLSHPAGQWRYTTVAPPDSGWVNPNYDDASWPLMIDKPMPTPPARSPAVYSDQKLRALGATGIGIPESAHHVWIRKRFVLFPPEEKKQQ